MYKFIILTFALTFISCKDQQLDDAMVEYCNCLDTYKGDDLGRTSCMEYMDSLQNVYAKHPRKLSKIIEKASECR